MVISSAFEQDRPYLWDKFQHPFFDPATGLDNETIKKGILTLAKELKDLPHPVIKAKAFAYVARNIRIDVSPRDWFPAFGCWDRQNRPLSPLIEKWDQEVNASRLTTFQRMQNQNRSGASGMGKDFDHSVPDWDALFSLGFPGIRERARAHCREREQSGAMTPAARAYFDSIEITYSAMLEMLGRFRDHALKRADGNQRMLACAACLDTLVQGPPTNTYEVLQPVYLYFMFSEYLDRLQVRSLGNLDRTLYPYYRKDLQAGQYTEAQVREFFAYFMMQYASIASKWGHPFYLGGTQSSGASEINELSHLILDVFD
jgi:formate C-acetyltransferase